MQIEELTMQVSKTKSQGNNDRKWIVKHPTDGGEVTKDWILRSH